MKRTVAVLCFLLMLGLVGVAPVSAQEADNTPGVLVIDQTLRTVTQPVDATYVVVAQATSDGPGWIVIHADENGAPGPVIGYSPLEDGVNEDIAVELEPEAVTETLYAMLHTDAGAEGVYEFPGADTPVAVDGEVVVAAFTVIDTETVIDDDGAMDMTDAVLIEVDGRTVGQEEFNQLFLRNVRTIAAQRGVQLNAETLALFEGLRTQYLELLATQEALLAEAAERDLEVSDEAVTAAVDQVQQSFPDQDAFQMMLTQLGFADEEAFRTFVRENLLVQQLLDELSQDIAVSADEVESFYDENQALFATPDGTVSLEQVRPQIEQVLMRQQLQEQITDLRTQYNVATYPGNLAPFDQFLMQGLDEDAQLGMTPAMTETGTMTATGTLLQIDGRTVEQAEFDTRFNRLVRQIATSQGIDLDEDNLAMFEDLRTRFLEQLATREALLAEAEARSIEADMAQVDETVAEFRGEMDEEAFQQALADIGFADEQAFRQSVREQQRIQQLLTQLGEEVEVTDEEIQTFYDENPRLFSSQTGTVPLDQVRDEIRQLLAQQAVNEQILQLREQYGVQTFPDNLTPFDEFMMQGMADEGTGLLEEGDQQPMMPTPSITETLGITDTGAMTTTGALLQIDGRMVEQEEFDTRFNRLVRQIAARQGIDLDEDNVMMFAELRTRFLDQLATREALLAEAEARGIEVSDEQVDATVAEFRGERDEEAFQQALTDIGFADEQAFRQSVREQQRIQQVLTQLGEEVEVTDEEIQTFYDENPRLFTRGNTTVPLDQVRDRIRQVLERQAVNEQVAQLREQYGVQTFPGNLAPFDEFMMQEMEEGDTQ